MPNKLTDNKDFFTYNNINFDKAYEITFGARGGGKLFFFEQLCIKQREEINRLQAEKEALINGQETLQKYIAEQQAENEKWQGGYMTQKQEIANLEVELKAMRGAANSYKAENERLWLCIEELKKEVGKHEPNYDPSEEVDAIIQRITNSDAPNFQTILNSANRFKAEVERLKTENKLLIDNDVSNRYPNCVLVEKGRIYTKTLEDYDNLIGDISAEAYKEFAERLDNKAMLPQEINDDYAVGLATIKKTLKELAGDKNEV